MKLTGPPANAHRGFTLVELLVASAALALMGLLGWRGLDGMMRTQDQTQTRLVEFSAAQSALAQWQLDIGAAVETGVVTAISFDGARLRFTREDPAGIRVVGWTQAQGQWWRWASPPVQRRQALEFWWTQAAQMPLGQGAGGAVGLPDADGLRAEALPMLAGPIGWQVFFFRGNAWTNPQSAVGTAAPLATAISPPPPSPAAPPAAPSNAPPASAAAAPAQNIVPASLPDGIRVVLTWPATGEPGREQARDIRKDLMVAVRDQP